MKFNWNSRLVTLGGLIAALLASGADAADTVTLKQVQVTQSRQGDPQIDLLFDGKVAKKQIRTEFFNDIIQISLNDTAVYPAKISSVNGASLTKVFAYQYGPRLVRCRLTMKGKAETYKSRIHINPSSTSAKMLTIRFDGATSDRVTSHAAQATSLKPENAELQAEEKKLLERVMKSPEHISIQTPVASAPAVTESVSKPLTAGKPLASPVKAFGKLIAVIGIFGMVALLLKKSGKLAAFTRRAKKSKMIEVLSTHYLGPKKSIAVVRVAGRLLVIGISNESINLIAQLSPGTDVENLADLGDLSSLEELGKLSSGAGAVSAGPSVFSNVLASENSKPAVIKEQNVRAKIRDRLEGLKQL